MEVKEYPDQKKIKDQFMILATATTEKCNLNQISSLIRKLLGIECTREDEIKFAHEMGIGNDMMFTLDQF